MGRWALATLTCIWGPRSWLSRTAGLATPELAESRGHAALHMVAALFRIVYMRWYVKGSANLLVAAALSASACSLSILLPLRGLPSLNPGWPGREASALPVLDASPAEARACVDDLPCASSAASVSASSASEAAGAWCALGCGGSVTGAYRWC